MGQQRLASFALGVFLVSFPAAAGALSAGGATPTPAVSFVANSPVLTQQSASVWTTEVVVDRFPACLPGLEYELVTTSPNEVITGTVASTMRLASGGPERAVPEPVRCGQLTAQGTLVTIRFKVRFATIPKAATLVLQQRAGLAELPSITLTMRREVTYTQYLWIPVWCGLIMAALFLAGVVAAFSERYPAARTGFWGRLRNRFSKDFWKEFATRPLFASAAWTFRDSWATNITIGVSAVGAVLTALGTVSTLLPGVQLDRFAVLMAACGVVIAMPPLIFGSLNTIWTGSAATLPGDSMARPPLTAPDGQGPAPALRVALPAGGSLSLPAASHWPRPGQTVYHLASAARVPIPPGIDRVAEFRGGWISLPGDATIAITADCTISINADLSVPAPAPWSVAGAAPGAVTVPAHTPITAGPDGAAVRLAGVADVTLPRGTQVVTPTTPAAPVTRESTLKLPAAGNMIKADMRSVAPAAALTMFGIGAQLGILGVLGYDLSAATSAVRTGSFAALITIALIVLLYAALTTRTLADAKPGSALSASATSFTY